MDHTTMSMPMAMAPAPDAAAAAAAAATTGSHPEHTAMGSSAAMMAMTFFQARGTPLFATGWAPHSGAAYAATCLFLVALGVVLRGLLALRPLLEALVWRPAPSPHDPEATAVDDDEDDDDDYEDEEQQRKKHQSADCEILFPASGKPEAHRPGARARHRLHGAASHPSVSRALWVEIRRRSRASRLGASAGRAAFELLLAVVGYLLMLAVMTMNLGYFASVLAGVFLGTFVLGDLATSSSLYQDHHC